jgi:hypothetical protein
MPSWHLRVVGRVLEIVPTAGKGVGRIGEGGAHGGTYGAAALLFGAADFEIGQTWYAGVFLEFCVGAMLAVLER